MGPRNNRREFLKQTALSGVGFWVAGGLARADIQSANDRLSIACIGVGGKGASDTEQAGNHGNIVAICDIDDKPLNEMAKKFPKAKKYHDFRKMLEEMGKQIDAVTVSTPDHTHAPASVMAMKMGKHVYCQKPLTHTVYEARVMRETARKQKVATQMGNQGTAEDGLRRAVEVIRAGEIGPVREVHVWTNRPIWPQAPKVTSRPTDTPPVPPNVHWDLFLGPAPERPYSPAYHPFAWRGWWDFGTGALGDMACHTANLAYMALKLGHPTSIVAESGEINPETYPAWAVIHFEFPAREDMVPARLTWYEGHRDGHTVVPPFDLLKGQKRREKGYSIYVENGKYHFQYPNRDKPKVVDSGSFLVGDKGILFSPDDYGAEAYILQGDEIRRVTGKPEKLPSNNKGDDGMKAEWVAAIRGGPPALSNFDYAALLTETILLGNVAMRVGKKIEWDGPNLRAKNCPEAEQFIRTNYRKGWTL